MILPSKLKALGPALTPQILLDFIKADGNILLALSASNPTPSTLTSLLLELDITLPADRNSLVVDHFSYDTLSAVEKHDVLLLPAPKAFRPDVHNYFFVPGTLAVPRAVGHTLGNASPLLSPILRAPSTAYSYNPKEENEVLEDVFAVGGQLGLISAMQARNSARFTLLGAAEMLEDAWFDADVQAIGGKSGKTANRAFAKRLSGWAFKELGVLKVGKLQHYLNEGVRGNVSEVAAVDMNPKIYRIKNDVVRQLVLPLSNQLTPGQTFTIEISEYSLTHWTPFTPPSSDALQLEFTMLTPFHRLPLTPSGSTANSTLYSASFTLPDQHGVFSFRVNYKRPFLTSIEERHEVTVRHFAHDEWPRSWTISGAWVWIAGIAVTVIGWVAFCALWLWSAPAPAGVRAGKKVQ